MSRQKLDRLLDEMLAEQSGYEMAGRRESKRIDRSIDDLRSQVHQLFSAPLTMRRFLAITRLFNAMRDEERRTGTVFTASDLERRREKYRRRLQRILNR